MAKAANGLPFEMKQPGYNAETEAAIQEARDILNGKIPSKKYSSACELFAELDTEMDELFRRKDELK